MKRRSMVLSFGLAALVIVASGLFAHQAAARVQDGDVCWEPDIEFPVPCDDDED